MGNFLVFVWGVLIFSVMMLSSIFYWVLKRYAEKLAELSAKDHYESKMKKL